MASTPFALRPWPAGDKKPKTLTEFISRISAEPGGFRSIDEESLRKEVELQDAAARAAEGGDAVDDAADAMDVDSDSEADDESPAVTTETIRATRDEVLRHIDVAHQTAMLTLDFVSLLLTKEDPTNAGRSLSQFLRDRVGIGTLGADKLAAPTTTPSRVLESKIVATGWKFKDINRNMDSVLSAAARLRKEIALETKYWAEVLAVSDNGWSVSRLPHEPQTLGVKFGFSEAAPEFRNNSLAPMRRSDTGTVSLDAAKVATPRRVLVLIERDGIVVGRSALPKPPTAASSLESRVMESRNAIFHQELWYELNREGRSLLAYNVQMTDSALIYRVNEHTRIIFRLQGLEDEAAVDVPQGALGQDDVFAETISSALQLLLSYAHRQSLRLRSQPGPRHLRQNRTNQPYSLLRPIITHLNHEESIDKAVQLMSDLTAILQSAGYTSAHYKLIEAPAAAITPESTRHSSASEALLASFLSMREFQLELTVTPTARISVTGRTLLTPFMTTMYLIRLPTLLPVSPPVADSAPAAANDQLPAPPPPPTAVPAAGNVLRTLYPPGDIYPNLQEASCYVRTAVARVIADRAEEAAFNLASQQPPESDERVDFVKSATCTAILGVMPDAREVRFEVCLAGSPDKASENEDIDESKLEGNPPELRVYGLWPLGGDGNVGDGEGGKMVQRRWTWTAEGARDGLPSENVDEVACAVLRGDATPP